MEDGYAICFNEWALDKDIKNELGLLLIISSLCAKGYCYATNTYFAELFQTNETLISRKLKVLEEKNYIQMEYEKRGAQIERRYIRLSKMITDRYRKRQPTIIENDKENNISINNTNKKEIYKERKFKKPTVEEVAEYCKERNNGIDAQYFWDSYNAKDWMIGKQKMKNWKSCIHTWERNKKKGLYQNNGKENITPDWFNEKIEEEEIDDETRRLVEEIEGTSTNRSELW